MKNDLTKKIIIVYELVVIIFCLVFNSLAIYENNADLKFLIISEFLLLIGVYYVIKTALNLNHYRGNLFLFVFNIIQSLAIAFLGFAYKASYGPQLYFKISNYQDWISEINLNPYSRIFYIDIAPQDGLIYIGVNIIQVLLAIHFFKILKREYGHIYPDLIYKRTE